MTYQDGNTVYSSEEQENRRSADYMAIFILVIMVIWLAGAALMFIAAFKGTTLTNEPTTAASTSAPATDVPAATQ